MGKINKPNHNQLCILQTQCKRCLVECCPHGCILKIKLLWEGIKPQIAVKMGVLLLKNVYMCFWLRPCVVAQGIPTVTFYRSVGNLYTNI